MKKLVSSVLVFLAAVTLVGFTLITPASAANAKAAKIPTFDVINVVSDSSVTIQTANFPANVNFDVRMGKIGTLGVNGILVNTVNSGKGGVFTAAFNIPAELKGMKLISIRLESKSTGFFSYNWFTNTTQGSTPTTSTSTPTPTPTTTTEPTTAVTPGSTTTPTKTATPSTKVPSFSIVSVDKNDKVTIKTSNFPANKKFDVRMGKMWTMGVNGTLVTSVDSGSGGTMTFTFDIPSGLKNQSQISIRLENKSSGFFAFNWFWNS